ncbi:25108_t:CDS:2 [Dentiscutata erythropus]|uniref:25108_t:CDS:1 n=1 Tax=Dentiscutata erythropus TaxID=1348616 RepID=A0A9N9CCZ1_9GLOM|nr:25108_t:CDS:2 [Dentiscutata erythropus]
MPLPDPIWEYFNKLGHVVGNFDRKKNYFGSLYKESDNETSISTTTSTSSAVNCISKREQDSLELVFAKSVFCCGLFLSLSEIKPIKDLWQQAKPTFRLPSRKKFLQSY